MDFEGRRAQREELKIRFSRGSDERERSINKLIMYRLSDTKWPDVIKYREVR